MNHDAIIRKIKAKKDIELTDANIEKKIEYLHVRLGLEYSDIYKLALRNPIALTMSIADGDPNSIEGRIDKYAEILHLPKNRVIKMFVEFPAMIYYDLNSSATSSPTSVRAKLEFFKKFFDCDDYSLGLLLAQCPQMLGADIVSDSPTSFKTKVREMQTLFNMTEKEIAEMIKRFPSILRYDMSPTNPKGLPMKVASLRAIGATNEQLVDNPYLLSLPVFNLKFRYMVFSNIFSDEEIYRSTILMIGNDKLYARFKFLQNAGDRVLRDGLRVDEMRFQKTYKVTSDNLIGRYPIDESALVEIEAMYNLTHKNHPLYFNSVERHAILGDGYSAPRAIAA